MKISIISASHRKNSQSKRVSDLLHNNLLNINLGLKIFSLDLADASLPFWSPDKKDGKAELELTPEADNADKQDS